MTTDLLSGLNDPQREAVMHVDGPLLVLAGAGSGKTRVITRRVAHMVREGVNPYNVLAITFTNKAAGEMRQRVAELNTPAGATVCTFHSLCARLLRDFAAEAALDTNYTIYDRKDQIKVAKQAIEECNLAGAYLTPARVHAAISNAKNDLKTPDTYAARSGDFFSRNVAEVFRKYEAILATNNALDFDDLLMRMAMLLRDRPAVREALTKRFRYVLIDEYQDTNHAQYLIAHSIALDHANICATGDPDQSIYAWRGADINNILEFENDYPQARVIRLEQNYRSVQPILSAASSLIANNVMRKHKRLFASRTGGGDVVVLTADDEHAEARHVARRIEDFRIAGGSYGDIALFYRLNSLSRVLEEALMRMGIPYRIARGVEFYNRREIKDTLAYLKLLANPRDDLSCLRIINTPTRGIGAATIKRLGAFAVGRGMDMLAAAGQVDQAGLGAGPTKKVRAFADKIASMSQQLDRPVRDVIEDVLKTSGLEEFYSQSDEDSQQARANLDELISSAAEFDEERQEQQPDAPEPSRGFPLGEYLQRVSLVSDVDHFEGGRGAVTLMTLHAAKGLEFPVVYIVGCEEGVLPFERNADGPGETNPVDLEEERRLAFVGMTRAKDALTLSCVKRRSIRGRHTPQATSRFLYEIGRDSVRTEDLTTAQPTHRPRRSGGGFYADTKTRKTIEEDHYADEQTIAMPDNDRRDNGEGPHVADGTHAGDRPHAGDGSHDDGTHAGGGSHDDGAHAGDGPHDGDGAHDDGEGCEAPFPPEYEHLRVGCMVHHPKFGTGKLEKLSRPWPDTRATITFRDFGQKKIVLSKTSIELMDL